MRFATRTREKSRKISLMFSREYCAFLFENDEILGGGEREMGRKNISFEESYISCWNEGGKDRRVVNVFERRIFSFFVSFFFLEGKHFVPVSNYIR